MNLTDQLLLDSYYRAIELELDNDFIMLLRREIDRRNLEVNHSK